MGWSALEKEAFDLWMTFKKPHWLTCTPAGFDLFIDHNNLIFIFDPLAVHPHLELLEQRKLLLWAVRLTSYNFTCGNVRGTTLFGRM